MRYAGFLHHTGTFFFQAVKIVDPIGLEEINQKQDRTAGPGDRIGSGNGGKLIHILHRDGDIDHPDHTPAAEHNDHRHRRLARAPKNTRDAVGEGQQAEEQADGAHMPRAVIHHLRIVIEEGNHLGREEIAHRAHQRCHGYGANDAEGDALFGAAVLLRAQILTHEGGKRLCKAGYRQERKAFQLGIGATAGHGSFAEAVDIGLHDHIRNGNHTVLYTRRQTVTDDFLEAVFVKTDFPKTDFIRSINTQQMQQTKQCAEPLRNGGGNSGRSDTEAEYSHKQHIKCNIEKSGENQIIQRVSAVADGMKNPDENVVHHNKNGPEKIIAEICDGFRENLIGCAHPLQNDWGQRNPCNSQHNADHQTECNGCVNGFAHIFKLFCSENTGNHDPCAHGNTIEKTDHHKNQTARRADSRQGIVAYVIADTPRIECIV